MLNGQLGQMGNNVLHLGIRVTALGSAKVVEGGDLVHEEIDNRNDNGDTHTVTPDDDDGDNIDTAILVEFPVVV